MTNYIPTESEAIGAYMAAASDHYDVPPNAIDQLSGTLVEQITPNKFRILSPQKRDDRGRILPDWAVITYDERTELWSVKLNSGETVRVRDGGDDFVVVADEE